MAYRRLSLAILTALAVFVSGCGGGSQSSGSAPSSAFRSKILSWSAPTAYTDSSPLNPQTDLDAFEIYVNESGTFTESDVPDAYVSAVNPATGQVITSFDLANLGPFLSPGVTYHVSLRAVALTGLKSAYSGCASFSF